MNDLYEFEKPGAQPPSIDDAQAEAFLKPYLGLGEKLESVTIRELPSTGAVLVTGVAKRDIDARLIATDQFGRLTSEEAAMESEARAHWRQHGKLSTALHAAAGGDLLASFRVQLLLNSVDEKPIEIGGSEFDDVEDAVRVARARRADIVAKKAAPVLTWLEANGGQKIVLLEHLSVIEANVPGRALLSKFLNDEQSSVAMIEFPAVDGEKAIYAGHGSMGDESFLGGNCGGLCSGFGLGAAVWEASQTRTAIADYNTRFFYATSTNQIAAKPCTVDSMCYSTDAPASQYKCFAGKCREQHATWVAGAIGLYGSFTEAGHSFSKAAATDTRMYLANDPSSTLSGLNWALGQGLLYVNRSQGYAHTPTQTGGMAIDNAVRSSLTTITWAIGNSASSLYDCTNWNILCVGSYRYGNWAIASDDVVSSFSTYLNNVAIMGADAERPHVVGPGESLLMPNVCSSSNGMVTYQDECSIHGPHQTIVGTSFAAPAVLGQSILVHQYTGLFGSHVLPVMKKITLMVGARDANGDGPVPVQGVDSRDGAGAPSMARVKAMLDGARTSLLRVTPADFTSSDVVAAVVFVPAGSAFRVGIAWNSCVTPTTNRLADFDLILLRPATATCLGDRSSTRTQNEFELMYDDCLKYSPSGGYYVVEIRKKAGTTFTLCNSEADEPVALAWDAFPAP